MNIFTYFNQKEHSTFGQTFGP